MLTYWMSHDDYYSFLTAEIAALSPADLHRLHNLYSLSLDKLSSLNLDPVMELITPYYSSTGRPALYQPQILRSFLLMLSTGETSIKNWINTLHGDHLMALLIGCSPDKVPSLGSHYDLIDRLFLRSRALDKQTRKFVHKYSFFKKPKKGKLKKGEKLPPKKQVP